MATEHHPPRRGQQAAPFPCENEYGTHQPALAIFFLRMTGAFLMFRRIELNVFEAVKQSVIIE